jgi:HEAT repeat protein
VSWTDALGVAREQIGSPLPDVRRSAVWVLLDETGESDETRAVALDGLADDDASIRWTSARYLFDDFAPTDATCSEGAAALDTANVDVRRAVAKFLVSAGPRFPAACDGVVACLRDSDREVRNLALGAEDLLAACPDRVVPILASMLTDADESVVGAAAMSLGRLGSAARSAAPAMAAALFDRNGRPRGAVALGLGRLGEDGVAAVPLLVACLRRGDDTRYGELIQALDALRWTPAAADIPRLTEMLRSDGWRHDERMWSALALIERAARAGASAVPRLLDLACGSTETLRGRVIEVIGSVSAGEPEAIALLIDALRSGEVQYCCTGSWDTPAGAARALGRIGAPARDAVPALIEALAFEGPCVATAAAAALRSITGRDPVR